MRSETWLWSKSSRDKFDKCCKGVRSDTWLLSNPRYDKFDKSFKGVRSVMWLLSKYNHDNFEAYWSPAKFAIPASLASSDVNPDISVLVICDTFLPNFWATAAWSALSGIQASMGSAALCAVSTDSFKFESVVPCTCCGDASCSCATAVNGANTVCDSNIVTTNADENFEDI